MLFLCQLLLNFQGAYALIQVRSLSYKLVKHNTNEQLKKYINERTYGRSQWILDERGKVKSNGQAIWYKPLNRKEIFETLKRFPLFSCIVLRNGEKVDDFRYGYIVEETASNYDLLIFNNCSAEWKI